MKPFYTDTPLVNLHCALPCEARPLIEWYQLQKIHEARPFSVFSNQTKTIFCIVSGVGIIPTASAMSWLLASLGQPAHATCLNIGIAGAHNLPIGSLYFLHKIVHADTQKNFYPSLQCKGDLPSATCLTVTRPCETYPTDTLIDMEASAFFQTSTQFVTQAQVACVKIISDTQQTQTDHINKNFVIELVHAKRPALNALIEKLLAYSEKEKKIYYDIPLTPFTSHWHFTQYQRHQLHALLRRFHALHCAEDPYTLCQMQPNAKTVLTTLKHYLDHANHLY